MGCLRAPGVIPTENEVMGSMLFQSIAEVTLNDIYRAAQISSKWTKGGQQSGTVNLHFGNLT